MAKKKPRRAWELLRRWKRNEIHQYENVSGRPSLRDYFTSAELRRIERRRSEAHERLIRRKWLRGKIEEAEDFIAAAGLPRDAWHALMLLRSNDSPLTWDSFILLPDIDPIENPPVTIFSYTDRDGNRIIPDIERIVAEAPTAPETWQVYWAACVAAAAEKSLKETRAVRQWTLARVIESFETRRRASEPGRLVTMADHELEKLKAKQAQARRQGARKVNESRRAKRLARYDDDLRRYAELMNEPSQARAHDRDRRARAVKQLADENNVEPKRMRQRLREARKSETKGTLR